MKKIRVDPESRRLVERTVQRRPRVSEKTSFQRRLGTPENVFALRGNEERMYSKPTMTSKSLKSTKSFREDFIFEKIAYRVSRN